MKFNTMTSTAILALVLSAPVTAAFAQADMVAPNDTEMQALSATKIAAADAVAAVETASGGKVVELSLDMEASGPGYRITAVAKDGTETNYVVDATTGTATLSQDTKSSTDAADESEGGDEGQDNGAETEDAN
ncbi:MAG: hypothetical protein JWR51_2683 [Devosia sp.]|uniref:PepSY domain-containing protein n=1 Tax=Devosia sp. TaxID=1871048 RepID=UPI00260B70DE|nr:PepSY domain-containing protein [Devosia sp.]MDB5529580.1 hypothetical protein [Devosia sp.]